MEYKRVILKPDVTMFPAIKVTKDTTLEFKNDRVEQTLRGLVLRTVTTVSGDNFESTTCTTVNLYEGEYLVFEEEGRGYIKPVQEVMTVCEAIEELTNIKDLE